ncbi:helicase-related protein [Clostridium cochlearium]|uniref:helicase-related protein n=1 Tax=Clostridium cochlearium TaxID=1494 RepID=UPI00183817E6|nr:helicase-related protein [Clostridium cochlearium]NMA58633.1 methyltransferase domain-containing protein [Clostridium cochlearium]
MSIKEKVRAVALSIFDFIDETDKIKTNDTKVAKPKRSKKNKRKKKSFFKQINFLEIGGKLDNEQKSIVHNKTNKDLKTNSIQRIVEKWGASKNTDRNGNTIFTEDLNYRKQFNQGGQFSFIEPGSNKDPNAPICSENSSKRINRRNPQLLENYKITVHDKPKDIYNLKEKCKDNILAIKTLKNIEISKRKPTLDEKKKLVKFVGWGGLAQNVFSSNIRKGWEYLSQQIKKIFTKEEYEEAKRNSLTAFYTPIEIIRFMYKALDKIGFTGGRILEPSCGTGHFFGCMPNKLRNCTRTTGIELDSISARICRKLYPKSKIYNKGFEEIQFEDNSFDLIISNIPFGNFKVYDKKYSQLNFKIHNYYFAKSLDLVRPGGIIAFITSHYTMDSKDESVRKYISKKAKLICAVRLPNNAFKCANTEVISDIIFLQKKEDNNFNNQKNKWLKIKENKDGILINEYFLNHPEMVIGDICLSKHTNQWGNYEIIVENKNNDLEKMLNSVLKYFPKDIYEEIENSSAYLFNKNELLSVNDYPNIKENAYEIIDNKLFQRKGTNLIPVISDYSTQIRIKELIKVKNALMDVIDFQVYNNDDTKLKKLQEKLNTVYDNFKRSFNHINSSSNKNAFDEDPSYPLLSSLEIIHSDGSIEKADIFFRRTIAHETKIEHTETIEEALTVSLNTNLTIDFKLISKLTDKSIDEVKEYLLENQLIFKNPENKKYEIADEYLTGNVVEKLNLIRSLALDNYEYKYNEEALIKVQPAPLTFADIDVRLGSVWVPTRYIKQFVIDLLEIEESEAEYFNVLYCNVNASWEINCPTRKPIINHYKNNSQYGTERITAFRLIDLSLNLKNANVYDRIYNSQNDNYESVLNKKETIVARQKQDEIKNAFADWIWKDKKRREELTSIYNKLFNSIINRKYDGSKLQLKGINTLAPKLRDYQKNVIARILYGGNTLMAHCVGAGKSYCMMAAGMSMRKLGLCKKPLYVIPNSLVESSQFSREFLQLYPTARILVATSKDFRKENRKKFIARIATGDWDGVIMGHSSFGLIPVSKELEEEFIKLELNDLEEAISNIDDSNSRTVKQLERTKINLQTKLEELLDSPKDNNLTFEQLGIDQIFVDEAHQFKNLFLYSKLKGIPGIPATASKKASDIFMKTQYVIRKNKGKRGVVFATGTPVTNSMAELYTMQRYLMYDKLKELNLHYFDAWASVFGEIVSSIEINPTGTGYRSKLRFAKFHNVPELMKLFRNVADIVTDDMLNFIDRPKLENNKYIISEISKAPEVENYIQSLITRAENIHNGSVDPSEDNMLCVVNDGKKVALDPRIVGIDVDYDDSKINTCIKNIYKEWENSKSQRLTQLVFCDLGTPKNNKSGNKTVEELLDDSTFNVYEDIKGKLIKMGVPRDEIAFIHDASTAIKKNQLFRNFRSGKVRILIGSTSKCGEGCNIQDKLIAMHHLDCPWRPADLQQREGRILRMGNINKVVRIYRYATKGTFDGYSWQTVETKAKFISQIMNGNLKGRTIEDIDEKLMSFAEMKAACSENPIIAEKIKNDIEIQKLQTLENGFRRQKYYAETNLENNERYIKSNIEHLKRLKKDLKVRNNNILDKFLIELNNKVFTSYQKPDGSIVTGKTDAGEYIFRLLGELDLGEGRRIGSFRGFEIYIKKCSSLGYPNELMIKGLANYYINCDGVGPLAIIQRIENKIENIENSIKHITAKIKIKESENEGYKAILSKEFEFKDELNSLLKRQSEINSKLELNFNCSDVGLETV